MDRSVRMMEKDARILVTGAAGMVGRRLIEDLRSHSRHLLPLTRQVCDLEDRLATLRTFKEFRPDYVFHLAAKVGGIKANMEDPVGFLRVNALVSIHVQIGR